MVKSFFGCNYKNLRFHKPIRFSSLNIFVGDNGEGKSNMVEAVSFLFDIFNTGFTAALKKRKYNNILNKFSNRKDFYLKWVINTGKGYPDLSYEINIFFPQSDVTSIKIKNELLKYEKPKRGEKIPFRFIKCHQPYENECEFPVKRNNNIVTERYMVDDRRSVFDQMDALLRNIKVDRDTHPMFLDVVESMKKYFSKWFSYNFLLNNCPGFSSEYTPFDYCLNENCNNFASVLRNLGRECKDFCDKVRGVVREVYPDIKKIYSILDENEVRIISRIKNKNFYFNELSTGIVKSILIATILFSPYSANIVCFENPEAGFSKRNQKIVADWIKRASKKIQLFITTSSFDFAYNFIEEVKENFAKIFLLKQGFLQEINPDNLSGNFDYTQLTGIYEK